jgi:DNA-binding LacI/PurR family transcriptional regulator
VVLPNYEMGQAAVELLLQGRSLGQARARRTLTKIDGPLVLRDSVAAPRPNQADP